MFVKKRTQFMTYMNRLPRWFNSKSRVSIEVEVAGSNLKDSCKSAGRKREKSVSRGGDIRRKSTSRKSGKVGITY